MVNLDNLFFLIEKSGLKTTQISKDTGISAGNIGDWKSGRSMPSAVKLDILANYFNVSVDYLLGRTNKPNNSYISGDNSVQINGSGNRIGDNSSFTINNSEKLKQDSITDEFMQLFDKLNFSDKVKIINIVNDIMKN